MQGASIIIINQYVINLFVNNPEISYLSKLYSRIRSWAFAIPSIRTQEADLAARIRVNEVWFILSPRYASKAFCINCNSASSPVRNCQFDPALNFFAYSASVAGVSCSGSMEIDTKRRLGDERPIVAWALDIIAVMIGQMALQVVKIKFTMTGLSLSNDGQ